MLGAKCIIRGTDLDGVVVGARYYTGDQNRYTVRFLAAGVPHEREFTIGELTFSGAESNVVAMERKA